MLRWPGYQSPDVPGSRGRVRRGREVLGDQLL